MLRMSKPWTSSQKRSFSCTSRALLNAARCMVIRFGASTPSLLT